MKNDANPLHRAFPGACADPSHPSYWRGLRIRYSRHAQERTEERGLPILRELPHDKLRLVDVDISESGVEAIHWKVCVEPTPYFVSVVPTGKIITVWYKEDALYADWRRRKDGLRDLLCRL